MLARPVINSGLLIKFMWDKNLKLMITKGMKSVFLTTLTVINITSHTLGFAAICDSALRLLTKRLRQRHGVKQWLF